MKAVEKVGGVANGLASALVCRREGGLEVQIQREGVVTFAAVKAVEKGRPAQLDPLGLFAAMNAVEKQLTLLPRDFSGFAAVKAVEKTPDYPAKAGRGVCRREGG